MSSWASGKECSGLQPYAQFLGHKPHLLKWGLILSKNEHKCMVRLEDKQSVLQNSGIICFENLKGENEQATLLHTEYMRIQCLHACKRMRSNINSHLAISAIMAGPGAKGGLD